MTELLLSKGYEVHGLKRRSSTPARAARGDGVLDDRELLGTRLFLHYGDLNDSTNLVRIIQQIRPDELYNLAAHSAVAASFDYPVDTANVDALGTLRLLEAIRVAGLAGTTRYYQSSTSELFGNAKESPQRITTPFYPRSPYAVAKLYSHWITINYREAYNMYACCGVLFNHESPRRGEGFVTRKITKGLARIKHGLQACLFLGNLDSRRDWGHARDYVEMQWLMLQQDAPRDFVIATGRQFTVKQFVEVACKWLELDLEWRGEGVGQQGFHPATGAVFVAVDPQFFRPTDVVDTVGDSTEATELLGWKPKTSFEELVREMVEQDEAAAAHAAAKGAGK